MASKTLRRDPGSGGLYQDARGLWTAAVTLPPDPATGKRRRKVVRARTREAAQAKLKRLRTELDRSGDLPTASPTLAVWLDLWLRTVSASRVRPSTQHERERDVRLHITPAIGRHRLDRLTTDHVYAMRDSILAKGNSPTTALRCHRLLSVALRDAYRSGRVSRNVADRLHADAPTAAPSPAVALDATETMALLAEAARDTDRLGARWALGLLTGARRGECLGLEWDRIDWQRGTVELSWQLQRLPWRHGCEPPCGAKRGADCPARHFALPPAFEARPVAGGLHLVRPKTSGSWRVLPFFDPLQGFLERHLAARRPGPDGLVFTDPAGRPIDKPADHRAWKALLDRAGVRDVRQHDGRHTASTLLMVANVDRPVVSQILGHSTEAMTHQYQHANLTMAREGLTRVGQLVAPRQIES